METSTKNVKERLEILLNHLNINQKELAKMAGISENTISNAKNGKNVPVLDFFNAIYKVFPNLNPAWLYMGVGEMFSTSSQLADLGDNLNTFGHHLVNAVTGRGWLKEKECNDELEKADREITHLKTELEDKKEIINLLKKEEGNDEYKREVI